MYDRRQLVLIDGRLLDVQCIHLLMCIDGDRLWLRWLQHNQRLLLMAGDKLLLQLLVLRDLYLVLQVLLRMQLLLRLVSRQFLLAVLVLRS